MIADRAGGEGGFPFIRRRSNDFNLTKFSGLEG